MNERVLEETRYIGPESLLGNFEKIGGSVTVTTGKYQVERACEIQDIAWNHMDQGHRPCVHHTYEEALRLVTSRSFALSLTRVGIFKWMTMVVDIQLEPGLYYQAFTLFNIFYVHQVIQFLPQEEGKKSLIDIEWYIVSHPLFKFLHRPISDRLYRLSDRQNRQDASIQLERARLRKKGYRFCSDNPDFLSSNTLTDNVIPPRLAGVHKVPLSSVTSGELEQVSVGPIDLLVRRNPDQSFTVWPATCPHEGGPLKEGQAVNGEIVCRWHHLRQQGAELSFRDREGILGDLKLTLEGETLSVQQRE